MRSPDPRQRLTSAALQVVRETGIASVSARAIARAGGFSQALIYYHFDSVDDLLAAACRAGAAQRAELWAERLATVGTFSELVDLAEQLHAEEAGEGNVAVLAQFIAGAHTHPGLAQVTGEALESWLKEVRPVMRRLLEDSVVEQLLQLDDLTDLVVDAFLGIELASSTRPDSAMTGRFGALRELASIVEAVNDLGKVQASLLSRRLERRGRQS